MRLGRMLDPVATLLLGLWTVSGSQWALRATGLIAMAIAVVLTLPGGLFVHIGTVLVTLGVGLSVLVQVVNPDSDIGLLAPLVIILALVGQDELTLVRAAGVGVALLVSHSAFALAATLPAHGVFERSAWSLGGRGFAAVLAVSVVGGVVVLALSGLQFGPWMLVAGVLAVLALLATVLPRTR
ncbi:hypothetical protein ACFQS2_08585 [Brachybacterium sp. GCM10030267]|uniref:hypothetical protein n=1 Tax=unclassified Brachybacterium TaxID=2623841 RepID=UPI0036121684